MTVTTPIPVVPVDDRDAAVGAPRLVPGTELIGRYHGSGYRSPRFLLGRPDGQIIQVSELLYRLAGALDGQRDPAAIADLLTLELGREVDADRVSSLLEDKLRPAGLLADPPSDPSADPAVNPGDPATADPATADRPDGAGEAGPAGPSAASHGSGQARPSPTPHAGTSDTVTPAPPSAPRSDHLLMLRHRLPVVSPAVTWVIAGAFTGLHRRVVVAVALTAFVALDIALIVNGGLAAAVPAALALVQRPELALAVLGLVIVSGAFHECGHVSACRFGGARPGSMGVGIYLVWPAFYSTVTDSYRLSRAGRLRTDLGGVYFNTLFIAGTVAAWLATDAAWLLLVVLVLHTETARQFLPSIRLDGYYILSDLIGLPDLFTFLRPVLRSALPGGRPDPRVAQLRPHVRRVIIAWVAFVVPFLAVFLIGFLALAPHAIPAALTAAGEHLRAAAGGIRFGDPALAALGMAQSVLVLLPLIGGGFILCVVLRALATPLLPTRRPRPDAGPLRVLVVVLVVVLALGLLAMATVARSPAGPGEMTLAATAAGALPGGPLTVVAAQQVAALDALFGGFGQHTVLDAARGAQVLLGLLGALLLWPVGRRIGLSPPVTGVAVVLAGVGGLVLGLANVVDPGGIAAVWLVVAAGLAGRSRGATVAAVGAAAIAVVTAPVAAVGVLAFLAHGTASGQLAGRAPARGRWVLGALAAAGAIAVAVVVFLAASVSVSSADLAEVAVPVRVGAALLGLLLLAAVARSARPVLPVATGLAALLVVLAVAGTPVVTVLQLALPALAMFTAALLDRLVSTRAPRRAGFALAGTVLVAAAAAVPLLGAVAADPAPPGRLAAWVRTELDPTLLVAADPLTTAQLRADGVTAERIVPLDTPGAVQVRTGVPGGGASGVTVSGDTVSGHTASEDRAATGAVDVLYAEPDGPAHRPVAVTAAPTPSDLSAPAADLGPLLVRNPNLRLDPSVAQALQAGEVDPRLISVLSGLSGIQRLTVAELPAVPGEPGDAPRRSAVITAVNDIPVGTAETAEVALRWLAAQQPPFRPLAAEVVGDRLILRYPAPSPRVGP